ncbi:hypothetical protein [Celerinatantimonas diazotrophica]|uniref:Uncharacterized protein n=1 Tax=Celerinatantimonas diazotrophica TaxID=412034 RepID=A0A4R1K156_9GAMM|nr:hypothetical protein [Celerinatantimonas diazotrophica]TCK57685.1 hypothetical protein EV690_1379 [Celerinatantimonas diazotrophica]CAG9298253.1 hypothetical protein CEDIAZO_03448 [Celerinatantimonas diazotrophica]
MAFKFFKLSQGNKDWIRLILSLIFTLLSFVFPTDDKTQLGLALFFSCIALICVIQLIVQQRRRVREQLSQSDH